MTEKYIYHVFPLTAKYLTLDITEQFVKFLPSNHFFYIVDVVEYDALFKEYTDFFDELNFKNYKFSNSINCIFNDNIGKNETIILHGDNYNWKIQLLLKKYKSVKWVCWGSAINLPVGFKNKFTFLFKKYIYQKLHTIIALTDKDKEIIEKVYKCKNVKQIQYVSNLNTNNFFTLEDIKERKNKLTTIYLGNNVSCLPTYPLLLELISKFKNEIQRVICMLNYNLDKNDQYLSLLHKGNTIFGNKFATDEKLYTLSEYKSYMDKCDIYICNETTQTGLGAIYTTLRLGKKIYLNGNNYSFIKQLGCNIYHVNEIENCNEIDFLNDISYENKLLNFKIIEDHLNLDSLIEKWKLVLI